jgi:hypothetical protein
MQVIYREMIPAATHEYYLYNVIPTSVVLEIYKLHIRILGTTNFASHSQRRVSTTGNLNTCISSTFFVPCLLLYQTHIIHPAY